VKRADIFRQAITQPLEMPIAQLLHNFIRIGPLLNQKPEVDIGISSELTCKIKAGGLDPDSADEKHLRCAA